MKLKHIKIDTCGAYLACVLTSPPTPLLKGEGSEYEYTSNSHEQQRERRGSKYFSISLQQEERLKNKPSPLRRGLGEVKLIAIQILCALLFFNAHAQKMTLPMLIEQAQKQNLSLRAGNIDIESRQMLVNTAKELPKAQLETQLGNIQNPNVFDYMVGITQSFEHKKVYQARKELLTAYVEESRAGLNVQRLNISLKIKQLYHAMTYYQSFIDLMQKQDSLYKIAAQVAQSKYKVGESNLLEKVSNETQYKELKNRILRAKMQYESLYFQLVNLTNWKDTLKIEFTPVLRKKAMMIDFSQNPSLLYLQKQSEMFTKQTQLDQQALKPDFKLGLINQSMQGSVSQFIAIGGIGIPIFKNAQKARIEASKISQQAAQARIESLENQLINELRSLQNQQKNMAETLDYYENSALPQAQLLSETALKRYKAGEIDYLEWHQNHIQAQMIKEQYLQSLWNYQDIGSQMEYILGN